MPPDPNRYDNLLPANFGISDATHQGYIAFLPCMPPNAANPPVSFFDWSVRSVRTSKQALQPPTNWLLSLNEFLMLRKLR